MEYKRTNRRVCASLTEREYEQLSFLAQDAARTPAGYLHWLLHQHLRELEKAKAAGA